MLKEKEVSKYLETLSRLGIRLGLENMRRLVDALGLGEEEVPFVHIGGTVGKGSTAHLLASILEEEGMKCGLYTSPHIYDIRERFRINGRKIKAKDFRALVWEVKGVVESLSGFHPTQFEVLTAVALLWFAREGCDIGVLEVGLGGRLDATNIVRPRLSIITDIGIDHTDLLGETVEEIAREKAGIIKAGIPLLTSAEGKALEVIRDKCKEVGAPLFLLGEDILVEGDEELSVRTPWGEVRGIRKGLRGKHQRKNVALAVAGGLFLGCGEEAIRRGVKKTRIEGRLEIVRRAPLVVMDGAHNPPALSALRETIKEEFRYRKLILLFGMLRDKPLEESMREILPFADCVILTPLPSERSASLQQLMEIGSKYNRNLIGVENPEKALEEALKRTGREDLLLITGSFYLLGALSKARIKAFIPSEI